MACMCFCVHVWVRLSDEETCVLVHLGPFSMKSALLFHSEWAQRAAPGLQGRPRQNGA